MSKISWFTVLLALVLAETAPVALALPDDAEQPIKISADQAVRDEKEGVTIYSGNVRMSQGSLQLEADKITVFRVVDEADRIVAVGKPAHLQQQPAADQAPVHAHAGVIEYLQREERVKLREDARLEQDGSIFTGEFIDYKLAEQRVRATSDKGREDSRVEVVIPARTLNRESDNGSSESE